jgi:cytochrome c biogenesis protein
MKYGLAGYKLIRGLNILDMYHSWWFQMMIVVLSVNIVVCSLDRLPAVWKIVKKQPDYDVERFRKYKARQEFSVN